jgi:succinoglycan biosynthesis protein ExoL
VRLAEMVKMDGRVLLICPSVSHPRFHRRAAAIRKGGFEPHVYAFCRCYDTCNTFPSGVPVIDVGKVQSGSYLKRMLPLFRAARVIRDREKHATQSPVIRYGFGLDCALLARFAARDVPLVYEVGDLRVDGSRRNVLDRLFYRIEQSVLRQAALLVTTAPAFINEHFTRSVPGAERKSIVIENKIPSNFPFRRPLIELSAKVMRPIRLGIIGFLRYPQATLPFVSEVAKRRDSYTLKIHGDGPISGDLQKIAARSSNISFCGPFRNPDDLESIYSNVDLSYVVYDNREVNVRLAIPNKLYESLFFCKPLIVAAGTELAQRVLALNVGVAVDPREEGFCVSLLDSLSLAQVGEWAHACSSVPSSRIIEDDSEFVRALNSLSG